MKCGSMRARRVGFFIVLGFVGTAAIARQHDDGPQGGHPLNREKRPTLEDLLNAPDWGAEPAAGRPKATTIPAPPDPPQEAVGAAPARGDEAAQADRRDPPRPDDDGALRNVSREAQDLVAERHRIIDKSDMFNTLPKIFAHEAECARLGAVLQQCHKRQRLAAGTVDQMRALGGKAAPGALERAMEDFRNAQRGTQEAHGRWMNEVNVLQPLYEGIQPALADWATCYGRMRKLLRADRRDPNRRAVLNVLNGAVAVRPDFYEGRVLAALAEAYDGQSDAAGQHLKKACEGFAKFRLFGTVFAQDCCHAYLLLGQPDMVKDFVANLRKLDARWQSSVRCWLVGCFGMLSCRDNEADTFFQKALAKANVFTAKEPPAGVEPLLGDAALFSLTANTEAKRSVAKARQILEKAPAECEDWRVVRARAALAAADGAWGEAIALLDTCSKAAPPTIGAELAVQREAYGAKELWVRPRPPAKAAARAPAAPRKG